MALLSVLPLWEESGQTPKRPSINSGQASLNRAVVGDAHLDFPLLDGFRVLAFLAFLDEYFGLCATRECHVRERAIADRIDVEFCVWLFTVELMYCINPYRLLIYLYHESRRAR